MDKNDLIEQWFLRYGDDVYKFLVYYTGSRDAEDLVQNVFLKALGSVASFAGRAQPRTWLLTIARNTAIDHARKQRLRRYLAPGHESGQRQVGAGGKGADRKCPIKRMNSCWKSWLNSPTSRCRPKPNKN